MDLLPEGYVFPVPAPVEDEREARSIFIVEIGAVFYAAEEAATGSVRVQQFPGYFGYPPEAHAAAVYGWQALANAVAPALCTALGAWLGSRNGRKVRIKVGDIEAEAQTREEVEKLLARAQEIQQEIQQRNQPPKVIP